MHGADNRHSDRRVAVLCGGLALVVGGLLAGCHAAPKTVGAVVLTTPAARAEAAASYWQGQGITGLAAGSHRRVIIPSFVLEFVTEKRESGGLLSDRQKILDVPIGYVSASVMASGLKRKTIEYKPEALRALPGTLYQMVAGVLQARGYEVLATQRVVGAAAYQRFDTEPEGSASILNRINLFSSDTGRVLAAAHHPADGLRVIKGARDGEMVAVERALLEELDADLSLQIRFRLGIFDERVSIEQGSTITLTTSEEAVVLTATRSLLSETQVVTDDGFMPVKGKMLELDDAAYRQAVRRLGECYLEMALEAARGERVEE